MTTIVTHDKPSDIGEYFVRNGNETSYRFVTSIGTDGCCFDDSYWTWGETKKRWPQWCGPIKHIESLPPGVVHRATSYCGSYDSFIWEHEGTMYEAISPAKYDSATHPFRDIKPLSQPVPEPRPPLVESAENLTRRISGALKQTIDAHGPITLLHITSAAKRIVGLIKK